MHSLQLLVEAEDFRVSQKKPTLWGTASVHFEQILNVDRLRCPWVDYIELRRLPAAQTLDYLSYTDTYAENFHVISRKYTGPQILTWQLSVVELKS